ncbi:hypothetical protein, partial [Craterilacuibacter sp.]|uniref:hypothetical protein n=1 Tax=Craterilacuibacter sp. TaxID=2870909 RepID=UPI003F40B107
MHDIFKPICIKLSLSTVKMQKFGDFPVELYSARFTHGFRVVFFLLTGYSMSIRSLIALGCALAAPAALASNDWS